MQKLSANEAPDPEYQYLDTLVASFPFHKVSSNIWLSPKYQGCARILFEGLLFCDLKVTLMSQLIGEKVLKVMQPGFRIDPLLSTLHCLRICGNYPGKMKVSNYSQCFLQERTPFKFWYTSYQPFLQYGKLSKIVEALDAPLHHFIPTAYYSTFYIIN